jgi:peptidoglycan glycosyltransferase
MSKDSARRRRYKSEQKERRKLNRQAMVTSVIFCIIFVFMAGFYLNFIVNKSQDIIKDTHNERVAEKAKTIIRGTIYAEGGEKLAYTDTNSTEEDLSDDTRKYPYGKTFAQVIGYSTKGFTGLEQRCNSDLSTEGTTEIEKIANDFSNTTVSGCNVYTTLNVKLQKKAYESIGSDKGAVFIMDPSTGAVLTTASKPSFNPEKLDKIWDDISTDNENSPLLNRATLGLYTPGSTFKIVTTLAYMNQHYNNFSYYCQGRALFHNFKINCFDGHAHGSEDFEHAFANSCNSAFSTMGDKLNLKKYIKTVNGLLFNEIIPFDNFNTSDSNYCKKSRFVLNENSTQAEVAQTSIGQGETLVTPAHMAMLAAAIANKGVLMKPYMIDKVENSNGTIVSQAEQTECKKLMTKAQAKQLQEYMSAVCDYGTARIFSGSSYEVYGKTGTAELDKNNNVNSWFVGYAKKGKKQLAIAVVYENIKDGTISAKECAKEIFDDYFK